MYSHFYIITWMIQVSSRINERCTNLLNTIHHGIESSLDIHIVDIVGSRRIVA